MLVIHRYPGLRPGLVERPRWGQVKMATLFTAAITARYTNPNRDKIRLETKKTYCIPWPSALKSFFRQKQTLRDFQEKRRTISTQVRLRFTNTSPGSPPGLRCFKDFDSERSHARFFNISGGSLH